MLKRLAKALDELAKNEELMGEIMAAAEEDLQQMEGEMMDDYEND